MLLQEALPEADQGSQCLSLLLLWQLLCQRQAPLTHFVASQKDVAYIVLYYTEIQGLRGGRDTGPDEIPAP